MSVHDSFMLYIALVLKRCNSSAPFTFIIPYYCSILSLLFVESTKERNAVAVDDFSQPPHHIHIAARTLIHPLEEKKRKSLINDFYPTISSGHMNHHGASTQKIPSKSKSKINSNSIYFAIPGYNLLCICIPMLYNFFYNST